MVHSNGLAKPAMNVCVCVNRICGLDKIQKIVFKDALIILPTITVEMICLVYCTLAMTLNLVCTNFFHVNMSSVSTSFLLFLACYWPKAQLVRCIFRTCFFTLLFVCDHRRRSDLKSGGLKNFGSSLLR